MSKLIHNVTAADRVILTYAVGSPTAGANAIPPALAAAREPVFKKLVKVPNAKYIGSGNYDFTSVKTEGLQLEDDEYNILKEALSGVSWPSMGHKLEADDLIKRVNGASDMPEMPGADPAQPQVEP